MLAVNVTSNLIFSPKVTHPFQKKTDFDVLVHQPQELSEKGSIIAKGKSTMRFPTSYIDEEVRTLPLTSPKGG